MIKEETKVLITKIAKLSVLSLAVYGAVNLVWLIKNLKAPGGSTPIIIADGSTHIRHSGGWFFTPSATTANLRQGNYHPYSFGYGCPLDSAGHPACADPPIPCSTANPKTLCSVDLKTAKTLTLSLCETQDPCNSDVAVQMTWITGPADIASIFNITSLDQKRFELLSYPSGYDLHHVSDNHLQSALLTVTPDGGQPAAYAFSCPVDPDHQLKSYPVCLSIDYECHVSGGAACGY